MLYVTKADHVDELDAWDVAASLFTNGLPTDWKAIKDHVLSSYSWYIDRTFLTQQEIDAFLLAQACTSCSSPQMSASQQALTEFEVDVLNNVPTHYDQGIRCLACGEQWVKRVKHGQITRMWRVDPSHRL